ncbi:MAG: adenylate/guanylate cyclase domain-containing protein [Gammaproteobacteria bacterium]
MWVRRLRLWSDLVVASFVCMHLLNHAFGLISLEAMDAARPYLTAVWWHPALVTSLYVSLALHFTLALYALYRRRSLRMPGAEALQLGAGLLIPLVLAGHVIGTRGANALTGLDPTYQYVMLALWSDDWLRIKQPIALLIVWVHVLVGLNLWLRALPRLSAWYESRLPLLFALAVLVPALSLLGYARAGLEVMAIADDPDLSAAILERWFDAEPKDRQLIRNLAGSAPYVFAALIASVFAARLARQRASLRGSRVQIKHPARNVPSVVGQTVLEALRAAGVPHASVCGGRARCTTCRIRVGEGAEYLAPPERLEADALTRVGAAPNVRLACQTRPRRDLQITPLVPPGTDAIRRVSRGGVAGREQQVVAMFVDLRDSTALGEAKLPYDVVFILNEFFAEMSAALEETRGHYAQFSGDGLMALYGLEVGIETGCRDALLGARRMAERLDALNERLHTELQAPLRIGIGIHAGDAIVGTMGPPASPNFSAIGDNINIAARLEALCKPFECALVVSTQAAEMAGVKTSHWPVHEAAVRGRASAINVYSVSDLSSIATTDDAGVLETHVGPAEPGAPVAE